ncbi:uncharacterized protein N0V89_001270 [Didymosphaeria variabile]|uniref:DUF7053 domain-containing protein n=1 Tax=Didymosphaeria variabile TaxID=1932322 RepID=A0A9W8XW86_9PLEO|nr:uncharacterized protein N0V89_001270 [Didymosphaeria variabile]KAJ4360703.1 hypothetical protein N0V89_001270 [Didymosphaeria variabile]
MFCKSASPRAALRRADRQAFSSTAKLHHVTPLPAGTTIEAAIEKLQNHDLLIHLDPELHSYETLPSDDAAPNTKRYKVTDHMHALPKGLWDSTVTFESQITNTEDGVLWVIKAPLGLVQQTKWTITRNADVGKGKEKAVDEGKSTEAKNEWSLVEEVEIKASRLLVGTVKGKCEENWRGIHSRFVGHLQGVPVKA